MRPEASRARSEDSFVTYPTVDALLAEYRRQRIRRDLSRWSRKVLLCLGLENIGKHIVGESKWEKLYDNGCTRKCSTPEQEDSVAESSMEPSVEPFANVPEKEPCSTKADSEDAEELDEDLPPDDTEPQENSTQLTLDETNSPVASPSAASDKDGKREEADVNMVVGSGSNDSSNNSLIAESAPNSNSRDMLKEEDDAQNTSRSGSTPSQEPASPTGSEVVDQEEGGGGALANNLFQILPYWYFLNRAFSMSSAEGGSGYDDSGRAEPPNGEQGKEDDDHDDEDEEMTNAETTTPSMLMNDGDASPRHASRSPETTQRINSLILLESLQQRLRTQGEQGASGDLSALNHGFYLSQLLSRMAGKEEDSGGRNGSFSGSQHRDHLADQLRRSPLTESVSDEQPLDLRRSNMKERSDEEVESRRRRDEPRFPIDNYPGHSGGGLPLPYMLDEQTSKVFRSNPRSSKGYTAQELQAALHDIQSGKLGTRRAAVIYGIPRSTLRNKVYKLGKDRGRPVHMGGAQAASDFLHLNNNNNNNNLRNKEAVMRKELLGKLSHFRPLSEGYQCVNNEPDSASFVNPGNTPSSAFSPMNGDHDIGPKLEGSTLSHLILKHAQAQKRAQQQQSLQGRCPPPLGMDSEDLRSSLYKDTEHGPSFLSGKDWKEALARHELLLQHEQRHPNLTSHSGRAPPQSHHLSGEDASSSMDLAGKKSRPKRGKYRNYDREALVKAVRAVQNGEMSVHRAGSFFGVPHSTLEYKVKERHLLRRPKRKEMTSPLTQSKLSSVAESSSDSGMMAAHSLSREEQGSSSFTPREKGKLAGHLPSNSHIFPVTTDLRESLSRYLSAEQGQKKSFSDEGDGQDGFDSEDGRNDGNSSPVPHNPRGNLRQKEENGDGGNAASALGGFIGNRLSDLFQLSDIFFRSGGGDAPPASREALLDLSKK